VVRLFVRYEDPAGISLRVAANNQVKPAVAHDGTNWLVGWGESSGISVARVAGDGSVLDSNAIAVTTNYSLGSGGMAISHAVHLRRLSGKQTDRGCRGERRVFGRVSECGRTGPAGKSPYRCSGLRFQ
jgi:hypothetical protein